MCLGLAIPPINLGLIIWGPIRAAINPPAINGVDSLNFIFKLGILKLDIAVLKYVLSIDSGFNNLTYLINRSIPPLKFSISISAKSFFSSFLLIIFSNSLLFKTPLK